MNEDRSSKAPKRPGGEAGFTLVEALCAILILVFGLMAVTNLLLVASTSNTTANQSTAATALASQQLEALKAIPFTDPGTANPNAALAAGGDLDVDQPGFFNPPADLAGVGQVQVRWLIVDIDPQTKFIAVRAEGTGALVGARSRAEFTVFRSCTDSTPPPGLSCPLVP
jgi:type II secretory pathway pseudopilin PulG